jgi:hypothetical protein
MIKEILQYMNAFVDGRGYAGVVSSAELPSLEVLTREYSAGGMSGAVEVRMARHEKLTASLQFEGIDPKLLTLFDIAQGAEIGITLKGSTQDRDGTAHAHSVKLRGFIKKLDEGEWKEGEDAPLKLELALSYYKREHDGVELIEADPINMIFKVKGVDQLAQHRRNIGR